MFQNNLCPLFFVHFFQDYYLHFFFLFLEMESLVVGPQVMSEEK